MFTFPKRKLSFWYFVPVSHFAYALFLKTGAQCRFDHEHVRVYKKRTHRNNEIPETVPQPQPGCTLVSVMGLGKIIQVNGVVLLADADSIQEKKCDIVIDGAMLEGGGQVLRNSFAYASIIQKTIRVENVRGGRAKPGLKSQHMAGLVGAMVLSGEGAELMGCSLSSKSVFFRPGTSGLRSSTKLVIDTGTAGSVALLCQVTFPIALFGQGHQIIEMLGGTNSTMAPAVDYLQHVLLPILNTSQGLTASLEIVRRGWFPRGGGKVILSIPPVKFLRQVDLVRRGELVRFSGLVTVGGYGAAQGAMLSIALATELLSAYYPTIPILISSQIESKGDSGACLILIAHTSTGCILAGTGLASLDKKKRALNLDSMVHSAVDILREDLLLGGCVDRYMQDQLILFMALAQGTSRLRTGPLTLHTRTAMRVAEMLLGAHFTVTDATGAVLENLYSSSFSTAATAIEEPHGEIGSDIPVESTHSHAKYPEGDLHLLIECRGAGFSR